MSSSSGSGPPNGGRSNQPGKLPLAPKGPALPSAALTAGPRTLHDYTVEHDLLELDGPDHSYVTNGGYFATPPTWLAQGIPGSQLKSAICAARYRFALANAPRSRAPLPYETKSHWILRARTLPDMAHVGEAALERMHDYWIRTHEHKHILPLGARPQDLMVPGEIESIDPVPLADQTQRYSDLYFRREPRWTDVHGVFRTLNVWLSNPMPQNFVIQQGVKQDLIRYNIALTKAGCTDRNPLPYVTPLCYTSRQLRLGMLMADIEHIYNNWAADLINSYIWPLNPLDR